MGYGLGVDLGTTYTAAATIASGEPAMLGLGNRALQVPSVVYAQADGSITVGEAAERRGAADPTHVVREFKRRIGDPIPILIGGQPYSPQLLTARLLRWVVDQATERMGEPPAWVTLTHPANWGQFKLDLLRQAAAMADLAEATFCPEPVAAALKYVSGSRVREGERICVYDLGGGTFDVCVLTMEQTGFRIIGTPEGIEHLGGVDFDETVFRWVLDAASINDSESVTGNVAGLARLRRDCVEAKEALSTDVEAVVSVSLGDAATSVRLTRFEFEGLIRPALGETVAATHRAIRSAGMTPVEISTIVLVGGSSRIPLISEMLTSEFQRPVARDTHPKHDVALGAAIAGARRAAAGIGQRTEQPGDPAQHRLADSGTVPPPGRLAPAPSPYAPSSRYPQSAPHPPSAPYPQSAPHPPSPSGEPPPPAVAPNGPPGPPQVIDPRYPRQGPTAAPGPPRGVPAPPGDRPPPGADQRDRESRLSRPVIIGVAALVAIAAVAAAVFVATRSGSDTSSSSTQTTATSAAGPPFSAPSTVSTPATSALAGLPLSPTPLADSVVISPRKINGTMDLYAVDSATGKTTPVTSTHKQSEGPTISPDRRTVVYMAVQPDGGIVLRAVGADGVGDRPLFPSAPPGCEKAVYRPAWNLVDPNQLALNCADTQGNFSLRIITLDGKVVRSLTVGQEMLDDMTWSPDGKTLAFWAGPKSGGGSGSIFTMPADGSAAPTKITDGGAGTDADPVFSPDGKQIVFNSTRGDGDVDAVINHVLIMTADGQNLQRLAPDNPFPEQSSPAWGHR